jgi:hypothetical protein
MTSQRQHKYYRSSLYLTVEEQALRFDLASHREDLVGEALDVLLKSTI